MRTTIDLDEPVLRELKRVQKVEGKSLGRLVSDLLAQALCARMVKATARPSLHWVSQPMGPRVELADKDAIYALMEREPD